MIDLFVEDIGNQSAPPLLYIHGGPGTGSYDFVMHQGELLSEKIRLIAVDQRGVLRSPEIPDEDDFRLMAIIEDFESIRKSLDIARWSVLGHSFGGYLGVLYAHTYPESVERLIFENGSFDLGLSARSLLQGSALEYAAIGDSVKAAQCLDLAFAPSELAVPELWDQFTELTNDLGEKRNNLYVHGTDKDFFEQLVLQSPFSSEQWGKAGTHQQRLFEEGNVFTTLLQPSAFTDHPTLLIKGKFDYVMSADQIQHYMHNHSKTRLVVFENSSHFPHVEEPKRFAETVIDYLLGTK